MPSNNSVMGHRSLGVQHYAAFPPQHGGFFRDLTRAREARAEFSPNTNVHPAFAVEPKRERNRRLVQSIYRQTQGYMLIGDRSNEVMSDPLHRPIPHVLTRARQEGSIFGRSRAHIRPAAPGQVTWKNAYWRVQRPPHMVGIGPYTQGSLKSQSILYRINYWLQGGSTANVNAQQYTTR